MKPQKTGKKRTFANRVGTIGENGFRTFCERQFLLPTKIEEDVGFDFICQVDLAKTLKEVGGIGGSVLAVCVRASTKPIGRIVLDRSDAQNLLTATFPSFVALIKVEPNDQRTTYFRFVDEEFSLELATFLESSKKTLSLTPKECLPEDKFSAERDKALSNGFIERTRLGLAQKRIKNLLTASDLTIVRKPDGDFAILQTPRLFDLFERSKEPSQDALYVAAFGSQEKQSTRLGQLHIKHGVIQSLEHLPNKVLFRGATEHTPVELEVRDQNGSVKCQFEQTTTGEHIGWVHAAGLSLTISRRTKKDNQWVHLLDAFVDPELQVDITKAPDLFAFLQRCVPGSRIIVGPNQEYEAEHFSGLPELAWLSLYIKDSQLNQGWKASYVTLNQASDLETLNTMALVAALGRDPNSLRGFGFLVGNVSTDAERIKHFNIPVIGNIGQKALVVRLDVKGTVYYSNETIIGVRLDEILKVEFESRDRVKKMSNEPEIIVHDTWPTVIVGGEQIRTGGRPEAAWGLRITPSEDAVPEDESSSSEVS